MKATIHINDQLWSRIESLGGNPEHEGRTHRVNAVIDRYATLIESIDIDTLGLSESEKMAVVDAHLSHAFMSAEFDCDLSINVEDALGDGLEQKWAIDGASLVAKLRSMPLVHRISLIEWIEARRRTF